MWHFIHVWGATRATKTVGTLLSDIEYGLVAPWNFSISYSIHHLLCDIKNVLLKGFIVWSIYIIYVPYEETMNNNFAWLHNFAQFLLFKQTHPYCHCFTFFKEKFVLVQHGSLITFIEEWHFLIFLWWFVIELIRNAHSI